MYFPKRKNQCFLIRRRLIPAARIQIPIPTGAFCVGTGVGRGVACTGTMIVVTGMVVTVGELPAVVGRIVVRLVCGVV